MNSSCENQTSPPTEIAENAESQHKLLNSAKPLPRSRSKLSTAEGLLRIKDVSPKDSFLLAAQDSNEPMENPSAAPMMAPSVKTFNFAGAEQKTLNEASDDDSNRMQKIDAGNTST